MSGNLVIIGFPVGIETHWHVGNLVMVVSRIYVFPVCMLTY